MKTVRIRPLVKRLSKYKDPSSYQKTVAEIIETTGITRGYCLVLGAAHSGSLARTLAEKTDLNIIVREQDPKKVDAARRALTAAGLYGKRVVVHQGSPTQLPYISNIFNLIVGDYLVDQIAYPSYKAELQRLTRPLGGTLCYGPSSKDLWVKGRLPGSADWTHLYANASNTTNSGDRLVRPEKTLALQWFGKPGPRKMIDRHLRSSAHLASEGRLFVAAKDRVIVVDAYNGTPIWERELLGCSRIGIPKDSSNMAVDDKYLYVVIKDSCHLLDVKSGATKAVIRAPAADRDWGYLAVAKGQIFGSAIQPESAFDGVLQPQELRTASANAYKTDGPVACSSELYSHDKISRKHLWSYKPTDGVIVNQSITIGPESVYFIENNNKEALKETVGQIALAPLFEKGARLICLDIKSGKIRWSKSINLDKLQHNSYAVFAGGKIIVGGSYTQANDHLKESVFYDVAAFDGTTGAKAWAHSLDVNLKISGLHGIQNRHPVVIDGKLFLEPFVIGLGDGQKERLWKDSRRKGCGQVSASHAGLFFRAGSLAMAGTDDSRPTPITSITRPGCWINAIPAGGVLLVPESSSGCVCNYAIQTSLAFMNQEETPQKTDGKKDD